MSDATFADGEDRPLRLRALDAEDLAVIAALTQDAVFPASEMVWKADQRRFALLLNRFRWEDAALAESRGRPFERVRSLLSIEDVQGVRSSGVPKGDADTVLSLLGLEFRPVEDGQGVLALLLAGDGEIEVRVEALEVILRDVTRPYRAISGKRPEHR